MSKTTPPPATPAMTPTVEPVVVPLVLPVVEPVVVMLVLPEVEPVVLPLVLPVVEPDVHTVFDVGVHCIWMPLVLHVAQAVQGALPDPDQVKPASHGVLHTVFAVWVQAVRTPAAPHFEQMQHKPDPAGQFVQPKPFQYVPGDPQYCGLVARQDSVSPGHCREPSNELHPSDASHKHDVPLTYALVQSAQELGCVQDV